MNVALLLFLLYPNSCDFQVRVSNIFISIIIIIFFFQVEAAPCLPELTKMNILIGSNP